MSRFFSGMKPYYDHLIIAADGETWPVDLDTDNDLFVGGDSKPNHEGITNLKTRGRIGGREAYRVLGFSALYRFWGHEDLIPLPHMLDVGLRWRFELGGISLFEFFTHEAPAGGGATGALVYAPGNAGVDSHQYVNNGHPAAGNVLKLGEEYGILLAAEDDFLMGAKFTKTFDAAALALLNGTDGARVVKITMWGSHAREGR